MRSVSERRGNSAAAQSVGSALAAVLVVMSGPAAAAEQAARPAPQQSAEASGSAAQSKGTDKAKGEEGVAKLSDVRVTEDALKSAANAPTASSFGFTKPLLETPRTVSFVSSEQLSLGGISNVDQLVKLVPGVYTTTRYGLKGGINVRGVQADNYYRGMKRLNMQGHARTELQGMDSIEVVKGPPSPIYGMGKIGGYVNMEPKSGRARTTGYLTDAQGFAQGIVGSYDRTEASLGVGGPLDLGSKHGGYYLYGLLENSNTYVEQVGVKQRFLQGTVSVDDFIGPFRLETGTQMQQSITTGAYMNRVTQNLLDHGTYITGSPLVNLDLNGDGRVGYLETYQASPVKGNITLANNALTQRWAWPTDAAGKPLPLSQFPKVSGIPQSLHDYLTAHPEVNCRAAQIMRGMPVGGPLPVSGYLPIGFVLNPCTVATTHVNFRRNGSWEREQNAKLGLGFADLIWDVNPDFTIKNQFFYDTMNTYKDSYLPYGEAQDIHAFEDKITVTRRVPQQLLPAWLRINSLASINYRRTLGEIRSSGGDFDWRQDVMLGDGHQIPNNSFWNQLDNTDYVTGAAATSWSSSWYDEKGIGLMFDVDAFTKLNLVLGWRYDRSNAGGTTAPPFDASYGQSPTPVTPGVWHDPVVGTCNAPGPGCPGRYNPPYPITDTQSGVSSGKSWSVSLSYDAPWGLRPYATYAVASLMLDGANEVMAPNIAGGNHIGHARLKEVGIKTSLWHDKLIVTTAAYDQTRNDALAPTDPGASANVSATQFRGVEAEIKFAPLRRLFVQGYALYQQGKYIVGVPGGTFSAVNARELGFQDVIDPATGNVIYPAEAFLYGGRANLILPVGSTQFSQVTGNPQTQLGLNINYTLPRGLGFYIGVNHFSSAWMNRIESVRLPAATPVDAAITFDRSNWHWAINGFNVSSERYFQAGSGDTFQSGLVTVMPTASWELTFRKDFR